MKKSVSRSISRLMTLLMLVTYIQIQLPPTTAKAEGSTAIQQFSEYMKKIDSGWGFTLAVSPDGRVASWGDNTYGQCNVPTNLEGVAAVSAGALHSLALKSDGTVVAWGDNSEGQCNVPAGLGDVIAISAGGYHNLALKNDGTVVAWGSNSLNQCNVPAGLSEITAISAGGYHSLALKSNGTVVAWGNDENGLCTTDGLTGIVAICAPWNHNLAIRSDNTVVAWGADFGDQLEVPAGLSDVVAISGSVSNSMALKSDGTVVTWGGFYGDYLPSMFDPLSESDVEGVIAISSEDKGAVALKSDGTITSSGDTTNHLTSGSNIIPTPRIIGAQVAADNSYVDVNINMGVYGDSSHSTPVSAEDFQLIFNGSGDGASALTVSSITKADGNSSPLEGSETTLRFHLEVTGTPTGAETLEIKPADGNSVYDAYGIAMGAGQTTNVIKLNALVQRIASSKIARDNSYVDVFFSMGVYGDSGHSTGVSADDFVLSFAGNGGSATGAEISSITKTDGSTALGGGETEVRFHLAITGTQNGDETIEIAPASGSSVYSQAGEAMPASSTTGAVRLSPPVPALVSTQMAPDNSYFDIIFNTGVYGQADWNDGDEAYGSGSITESNIRLAYNQNGSYLGEPGMTMKNTNGDDLQGGEKTIRVYLNTGGNPTGQETITVFVEVVFSRLGDGGAQTAESTVRFNSVSPNFVLSNLARSNRYVDVDFNMGLYGDAMRTQPVTASDFSIIFDKNGGSSQNVTIRSIKKSDSGFEDKASPLTGGENKMRFFLDVTGPASGTERFEIVPSSNVAIVGASNYYMDIDRTSGRITLYQSYPDLISYRLAPDNSYLDLTYNDGVYGDGAHSTAVMPDNFHFSLHTDGAKAITIDSIKKPDGNTLNAAGGDKELRLYLDISGIPTGTEYFYLTPMPIYNSLGTEIPSSVSELTDEIRLNAVPSIISAQLAEDNSYLDVNFSTGVYGDISHTEPVSASSFTLGFNGSQNGITSAAVSSVKRIDSSDPVGGETALRLCLDLTGESAMGTETLFLGPADGVSVFAGNGNAMPPDHKTSMLYLNELQPDIKSATLATSNRYVDLTFNTGVFGENNGVSYVTKEDFVLELVRNGGDADNVTIAAVRQNDSANWETASTLHGGEKIIRIFINTPIKPNGVETIEIKPKDGQSIYSFSGKAMASGKTTGKIKLNPHPKIISAEIAGDNTYADITFNEGVYGDSGHTTPISTSDIVMYFDGNGSYSITSAAIKSLKKNNGITEKSASPLTGGETTVRVFMNVIGAASGKEYIIISPADSNSIYNALGNPMSLDDNSGQIRMTSYTLKIASFKISDDNSYVDVDFNVGVYGANKAPVSALDFTVSNGYPVKSIKSVKLADNVNEASASAPVGGETRLRFFLDYYSPADGDDSFEIKPALRYADGKIYSCVYNASGAEMSANETTGPIPLNDRRPRIISAEMSSDNKYIDVRFDKGMFGDKALSTPVLPEDFTLIFKANGGNVQSVSIASVRKTDSEDENDPASVLSGGESEVRFFLDVTGAPGGEETIEIKPCFVYGREIYDETGFELPADQTTGPVSLNSSSPVILSSRLGANNGYIDVAFNTGVYGNSDGTGPVTPGAFELTLNKNGGTVSDVVITSAKRNDSDAESTAGALVGGEKTIRFFLRVDGTPNGDETVEIKPVLNDGSTAIYSSTGFAMQTGQSTDPISLKTDVPRIVSVQMSEGSEYFDVVFNTGVYGENQTALTPEHFQVILESNGSPSGLTMQAFVLRKNDSTDVVSASELAGGESVVRFFPALSGIPNGQETLTIGPKPSSYPILSAAGYELNKSIPALTTALLPPVLKIISITAPQISGTNQYVDVTFNNGVYRDANHTLPVALLNFQLIYSSNGGSAGTAQLIRVTKPNVTDVSDIGPDSALEGGEKTLRFFIYTSGTPRGVETIQISQRDTEPLYDYIGGRLPAGQSTTPVKLAGNLPEIISTRMGSLNKYIDVYFKTGIYGGPGLPVNVGDFRVVFHKNGGSAAGVAIRSVRKNDSIYETEAGALGGGEKIVRLFLDVSGVPSGQESIEIMAADGQSVLDAKGAAIPADMTTGAIRLLTPYPPSWQSDTASEAMGWMSDIMISAGKENALVLKNSGAVTAFAYKGGVSCVVPDGLSGVKAVAAGDDYYLALRRDGTVTGWGDIAVPEGLSGVRSIAAGPDIAFVLKNDGTVGVFGNSGYKDPVTGTAYNSDIDIPTGSSSIVAIASGGNNLLALKSDGTVTAWGANTYGEGNVPAGLTNVKAVSAAPGYSLALKSDGAVAGWGNVAVPEGLGNVAAVSAGSEGFIVLKNDGRVQVFDRLGVRATNGYLEGFIAVSAGNGRYCAIKENGDISVFDGEVFFSGSSYPITMYGHNIYQFVIEGAISPDNSYVDISFSDWFSGPLLPMYSQPGGKGALDRNSFTLTVKNGSQSVFDVAIKSLKKPDSSKEALASPLGGGEKTVRAFLDITGVPSGIERIVLQPSSSFSIFSLSGNNLLKTQTIGPIALNRLDSQKALLYEMRMDAGWEHMLSMSSSGSISAWGSNKYDQTAIPGGLSNLSQVSAGYHHSVGLLKDKTVQVWGENYYGQLDKPAVLADTVKVSAGGYHTLALSKAGTVSAWGDNFYGQCNVPAGLSGVVSISAGGNHSLALRSNGTVAAWGDNHFGQCSVPEGLGNVVAIAAGEDFSLALKADGTVAAWGENSSMQCEVPAGLSNVKAIAAGYHHCVAVKGDGTMAVWGDNSKGQCIIPGGFTGVVAVSAGAYFSAALREDGSILAWGDNTSGQCNVPKGVMAPGITASVLSADNKYVDITFTRGVYGSSGGTGPIGPGCFTLDFAGNSGTAANVTIKSVKKNNSANENSASALTGGETTVRLFLEVTGYASGNETIEVRPNNASIFDSYGIPAASAETTGIIKLFRTDPPIVVDNTSHNYGDKQWDMTGITWNHELKSGVGSNRMVVVGLYSLDRTTSDQKIINVKYNNEPMTFTGNITYKNISIDMYYLLDDKLPVDAGLYEVSASYYGKNDYLQGHSVSLCNVAQQGPEKISTGIAKSYVYRTEHMGIQAGTVTDNAMLVSVAGVGYGDSLTDRKGLQYLDYSLKSGIKTIKTNSAGAINTDWIEYGGSTWNEIALSVKSVTNPVTEAAEPPAPPVLPSIPAGDGISFEPKNLGFTAEVIKFGNKLAAVGETELSLSEDGETWGQAHTHPAGKVLSLDGKLFVFSFVGNRAVVSSSADGINWTSSECTMPVIEDDQYGNRYRFWGEAEINDIATDGSGTYVAVGYANPQESWPGSDYFHYLSYAKIWLTSKDNGATWTAKYLNEPFCSGDGLLKTYNVRRDFFRVFYFSGRFVAFDPQTVFYSLNQGDTFIQGKSFRSNEEQIPKSRRITDVLMRDNMLILTGTRLGAADINIFTSTDADTWTPAAISYKDPKLSIYDPVNKSSFWNYGSVYEVIYSGGTYAAAGDSCMAASADGRNWSLYSFDYGGTNIGMINGRFCTFTWSGLLGSYNLKDWYLENKNTPSTNLYYGNDKLYVTSQNGILTGYPNMELDTESPADGDVDVPMDASLTVSFTSQIKEGAGIGSIILRDSKSAVIPVNVQVSGKLAVITPREPLEPCSAYVLYIPEAAFKDLTDEKASQSFETAFVTAKVLGSPTVRISDPGPGAAGVPRDSKVTVEFSRNVLPGFGYNQIKLQLVGGTAVDAAVKLSGSRLEIIPAELLKYEQTYRVTIPARALKDSSGNETQEWSMEFTVEENGIPDTAPPTVEGTVPVNFGERVPAFPLIEVMFSEEVQQGDSFGDISLKDIRSDKSSDFDIGLETATNDGLTKTTMIIIPKGELKLHSTYRVTIPDGAIQDMSGNSMTKFSFVFTEEIRKSYPVLLNTSPMDQNTNIDIRSNIVLAFDRPIKTTALFEAEGTVTIKNTGNDAQVGFTASIKDNKLYIRPNLVQKDTPDDCLHYGTTYRLEIKEGAICDLLENADPLAHTITFTTEPESIVGNYPQDGSEAIPQNSCIAVEFRRDLGSLSKGYLYNTVILRKGSIADGTMILTRLSLSGNTLFIIPTEELAPDTEYSVELPRGAVNVGSLKSNYHTFAFTTGSSTVTLKDFTAAGGIGIPGVLVEGDPVSLDASGSLGGATDYYWDFGDGTASAGPKVSHTYRYSGNYTVTLAVTRADGQIYLYRKVLTIFERPDSSAISMEVSPQAPVSLNEGGAQDFTVTLKFWDKAVPNAPITVERIYPLSENKQPELLATARTDKNGIAVYSAVLPSKLSEYYISFRYADSYNGIEVNKETRRVLKSAVGKAAISGYVKNDRNQVLKGAEVSIGMKKAITDDNGFYSIEGLDVGEYTMTAGFDKHYPDVSQVSLTLKSTVRNFTLTKLAPTGNAVVQKVFIHDVPVGDKNLYFLQGVSAELDISALADWKGHEPGYIEFNIGGKIFNEADNHLVYDAINLKAGDRLSAVCVTADGARSPAVNFNIHFVSMPEEFPYELHPTYVDGKYMFDEYVYLTGIKTPNISSIPIIKGGPMSFLTEPAHVTGMMSIDGTFNAFMGKSAGMSAYAYYAQNNMLQKYYAKSKAKTQAKKDAISRRQSRSYMGSVELQGEMDVSFNWNYDLSQRKWVFDKGMLHLGIDADAYGKASYGIPGAPLSVYISGEFKVLMDTYLDACSSNGKIDYSLGTLDMSEIKIRIEGGVDAYVASASVYLEGNGRVRIKFPSKQTDYSISVEGGVHASALLWSVDIPFLEYTWDNSPTWSSGQYVLLASIEDPPVATGSSISPDASAAFTQDAAEFKVMDRNYLNGQSEWMPGGSAASKSQSSRTGNTMTLSSADAAVKEVGVYGLDPDRTGVTLMSNTFPNTEHEIVSLDNSAFMILVQDDPTRSDLNRTRTVYSIYDGVNWSRPLAVDPGDKTADFRPAAVSTQNGVIAAWENINNVLGPDAELKDALSREEIAVGRYDAGSNTWSDIHDLTSDSYLDTAPRLAADGSSGILVWTKSKSEDYSAVFSKDFASVNDIMFSRWNGYDFSAPAVIASHDRPVVNTAAAYSAGRGIVIYAVDEDNDLNTDSDRELYRMIFDGAAWSSPERLTADHLKDSDPQVCYINGKAFAAWDQDGKIVYTTDAGAPEIDIRTGLRQTRLQDTFTLAAGSDTAALVGPGKAENGQELFAYFYDYNNDLWINDMQLTQDNSFDRSASAAFINDELIAVYNRAQIVDTINPADGKTYPKMSSSADLKMSVFELKHDLAVSSGDIEVSEKTLFPGSLVTIGANVENKGSYYESGVKVKFYNGDPVNGRQIGQTQLITGAFAPGEYALAQVQWEVPSGVQVESIHVTAETAPGIDDAYAANNTAFIDIMKPDLELSTLEYSSAGNSYAIMAAVANIGPRGITDANVTFYYGDINGELQPVGSVATGALKAGETVELPYLWSPGAAIFIDRKVSFFAAVDITACTFNGMDAASSLSAASALEESDLENNVKMVVITQQYLEILSYSPSDKQNDVGVGSSLGITFNDTISQGDEFDNIKLVRSDNSEVSINKTINGDALTITPDKPLGYLGNYTLLLPADSVRNSNSKGLAADWMMTFTTENSTQSSGEDSSESSGGSTSPVANAMLDTGAYKLEVQVVTDMTRGAANISLNSSSLDEAFRKAKPGSDGVKTVSVGMPEIKGIKTYEIKLPAASLNHALNDRQIILSSKAGVITLPSNMLKGAGVETAGDVTISIGIVDKAGLAESVRELTGERPVIELKLRAGDRTIPWNNPDAPVTVSIPYTPKSGELADAEHITAWFIDGQGNIIPVTSGRYNTDTGMVTFSTTHFSYFAAAFVKKTFNDLGSAAWARQPVEVLASKGILKGVSDIKYSPGASITRADFIYSLVRTLGADAAADGNFSDISSDAYYCRELAIARKLGITNGTGNNKFSPDTYITRQDMMVMSERALRIVMKLKTQGNISDLDRFADKSAIASHAVNGVAFAVGEGLITGSGGKVKPLGRTTRAEAAMFLYRIYNKYQP